VGVGISRHIQSAYHWLGRNYEEGDKIFLFGFSRGAFTARSIAGFVGRGLLDLQNISSKDSWQRVAEAYAAYRDLSSDLTNRGWAEHGWQFFHGEEATPVHFVGVWETVGALGVPDDLEILNFFFEKKENWRFHDTKLGRHIEIARHAMALDEIRSSFTIARWNDIDGHANAKEVWFPGAHSDVGGGYADSDLSDGALEWMIDESHAAGFQFRAGVSEALAPNPNGVMRNSYKGAFAKLRSRPRNIDAMIAAEPNWFHPSAIIRQEVSPIGYPAYHPTRILEPDESLTVEVFANTHWNYSGLYLAVGSYTFSATGEWQDSKDTCDWKGTEDGQLTAGDLVRAASSFLGEFEHLFEKVSKNESTYFFGTKRVENLNWFTLIGAIANDSGSDRPVKEFDTMDALKRWY